MNSRYTQEGVLYTVYTCARYTQERTSHNSEENVLSWYNRTLFSLRSVHSSLAHFSEVLDTIASAQWVTNRSYNTSLLFFWMFFILTRIHGFVTSCQRCAAAQYTVHDHHWGWFCRNVGLTCPTCVFGVQRISTLVGVSSGNVHRLKVASYTFAFQYPFLSLALCMHYLSESACTKLVCNADIQGYSPWLFVSIVSVLFWSRQEST